MGVEVIARTEKTGERSRDPGMIEDLLQIRNHWQDIVARIAATLLDRLGRALADRLVKIGRHVGVNSDIAAADILPHALVIQQLVICHGLGLRYMLRRRYLVTQSLISLRGIPLPSRSLPLTIIAVSSRPQSHSQVRVQRRWSRYASTSVTYGWRCG